MTEHKTCKGCKWNEYPICKGIIMPYSDYMNIEKLTEQFLCNVKEMSEVQDQSIVLKSPEELKLEDLEERIKTLEGVK